jgi:hypothetical protein
MIAAEYGEKGLSLPADSKFRRAGIPIHGGGEIGRLFSTKSSVNSESVSRNSGSRPACLLPIVLCTEDR